MTVKINDTLITSSDLQGQTANYFDTDLKLLTPSSSDDKIKRLLSCDAEKQYLQYKANQSIPYDLITTHNIQVIEQPADNTELYEYSLGSNKCKEFNLTFKVKDEAVTTGTKFLLEQPGLLSCKSQDNTLYFRIPEWDNAWKKVDPEVLKSNNTITLEAYNSSTGTNIPYYAYTNENTSYYIQTAVPNSTGEFIATWTRPAMSSNGTFPLTPEDFETATDYAVAASNTADPYLPYRAFDDNIITNDDCWWTGNIGSTTPCWITYFTKTSIKPARIKIRNEHSSPENCKYIQIQASNDNSNWDNLTDIIERPNTASYEDTYTLNSNKEYHYIRIYCTEHYSSGWSLQNVVIYEGSSEKSIIYNHTNNEFTPLNPQPEFTAHIQGLENASVVGTNLQNNNGIFSGFDDSNYLLMDASISNNISMADLIFKANSTSLATHNILLARQSNVEQYFGIRYTKKFSIYNGGWTEGTNDLNINTWYWFRVIFDGTDWTGYTLEDNNYTSNTLPEISQWRQEWTTTSNGAASWIKGIRCTIGKNLLANGEYMYGSIDMKESSITIDGVKTTFYSTFTGLDILDPQTQSYVQYPRNTQGDLVDTVYFADRLKLTVNEAEYTLVDNLEDMPLIKTGVLAIREDLRR